MENVLITGGAGFIGSNLAHALVDGYNVRVIDDLSLGRKKNLPENVEFVHASILDMAVLREAMKGIDTVFHLAAIPGVPQSIDDPVGTSDVNILGTVKVLRAATEMGVSRVIFASSCAVYGSNEDVPLDEDTPVDPLSPYATSKYADELMIRNFHDIYGMDAVILRFFNVYGPRQNPDSYYSAVIPKFIKRAILGEDLIIYGDGTQTRDFVFVEDVVSAMVLSARSDSIDFGLYNIGTGTEVSINNLAETIVSITSSQSRIIHSDPIPGEVHRSMASIDRARRELGWKPGYGLEEGLRKTVEFIMENELQGK